MRKFTVCVALAAAFLMSSCLGSFSAVTGLKNWNDSVSDSKFVNNLVFWGLNIIPVYGLFVLGDVVIFNLIEFWSGSNPIAMNEGDIETKTIKKDGNLYQMTATKNRLAIEVLEGPKKGDKLDLQYVPEDKSWNAVKPSGEVIKLSSYKEGIYYVYMPNGEKVQIDEKTGTNEGLAIINKKMSDYYAQEGLLAENN
jgi:hypothetical protein